MMRINQLDHYFLQKHLHLELNRSLFFIQEEIEEGVILLLLVKKEVKKRKKKKLFLLLLQRVIEEDFLLMKKRKKKLFPKLLPRLPPLEEGEDLLLKKRERIKKRTKKFQLKLQ